jgi:heme exporter protein B
MPTWIKCFIALFVRDVRATCRNPAGALQSLGFYWVVILLCPFAVGHNPTLLTRVGPGFVWVAVLLSALLSLDGLFVAERQQGTLELLLLSPAPLSLLVLSKVLVHWLVTGLPMVLLIPVVGLVFQLPSAEMLALMFSVLLATPILSLLGAIGAGLTVGLPSSGFLLAILMLPLYIPVLIFGEGVVANAAMGLPINGLLALLAAILLVSLVLAPAAIAFSLRLSQDR